MSAQACPLVLKAFVVGPLATNCYLLANPEAGKAIVVDPGVGSEDELEPVLREADRLGVEIGLIINTHGHPDHVSGNGPLKASTGARVLIHEADAYMLLSPRWPWPGLRPIRPDGLLEDGNEIRLGDVVIRVIHTPGHTMGSVSLYCPRARMVLTGDTLFAGSIGRIDFPESSHEHMVRSLVRLMELPDKTTVYPGHGPPTTIGAEREGNHFVRMALIEHGLGQG